MEDDQEKFLEDAVSVVKQESLKLQRALDAMNFDEVIKATTSMLNEMKTSLLSPKNYYELYMQVFDQLSHVERFFMEEYRKGRSIEKIYERVQFIQSIVPRIYLVITAGSVFIKSKEKPSKDLLKDMVEMCKGVQHPMRGLFLRYYLNKLCKDKLPDIDNDYSGPGGDVTDSIDFLLNNLGEMNRLWIRIQYTGGVRDKKRREKERNDLRVTVGENIVRLSNLEGATLELYESVILPKLLETVNTSNDVISQQYLMDCVIQAFPDEYHLNTLEPLLDTCSQLLVGVDIRTVFINLMDRLSNYADENEIKITEVVDVYSLFKKYIDKIIDEQAATLETGKLLELLVAFLRFSLKCYPQNSENVNEIMQSSLKIISKGSATLDSESTKSIVKLLSFPLESLSLAILTMPNYPLLMNYLNFNARKQVAIKIVEGVVKKKEYILDIESLRLLIDYINPLLQDEDEMGNIEYLDFSDEMNLISKLTHLIYQENPDEYFEMLGMLKRSFVSGGKKRIKYTFPALVFAYIRYSNYLSGAGYTIPFDRLLRSLLDISYRLNEVDAVLTLRLNMQIAQCIDLHQAKEFEEMAYEFASQSLVIYQNELVEPEVRSMAITTIIGSLNRFTIFDGDNYDTLITNAAQFACRQNSKLDMAKGAINASQLFWNHASQEGNRVVEYLKKAFKFIELSPTSLKQLQLYLWTLNKYLMFIQQDVAEIDAVEVNQLVSVVNERIKNAERNSDFDIAPVKDYLKNTSRYASLANRKTKLGSINVQV